MPANSEPGSGAYLQVRGLTKRFGGVLASDKLNLDVKPGKLHALIGPNGAGKSTVVAQISGEITPTSGAILLDGADLSRQSPSQRVRRGLARTFQITQLLYEYTAEENVALAVQVRQGHSFRFWKNAHDEDELRKPARDYLGEVGLICRSLVPAGKLSYGEQRQLEVAVALATNPRLLMLDEPLAGLGIRGVRRNGRSPCAAQRAAIHFARRA